MKIYKYHGCENSFLIMDTLKEKATKEKVIDLCQKYETDGLLLVDKAKVRIYNCDGSEASMCGNGLRCLTNYLYSCEKKAEYKIETNSGEYVCKVLNERPFISSVLFKNVRAHENYLKRGLVIDNKIFTFSLIYAGVWHAIFMNDICDAYYNKIVNHDFFKDKVNVDFVEIISPEIVRLQTYEVGVGLTKSCGSGAVATFYLLHNYYDFKDELKVITDGGSLMVLQAERDIELVGPSKFMETIEDEAE